MISSEDLGLSRLGRSTFAPRLLSNAAAAAANAENTSSNASSIVKSNASSADAEDAFYRMPPDTAIQQFGTSK